MPPLKIVKSLKKKALKALQKRTLQQKALRKKVYRFAGVCRDTGIHWWVHPDDEASQDANFVYTSLVSDPDSSTE